MYILKIMENVNKKNKPLLVEVPKPIKDMTDDELYAFADTILEFMGDEDSNNK